MIRLATFALVAAVAILPLRPGVSFGPSGLWVPSLERSAVAQRLAALVEATTLRGAEHHPRAR